MTPKLVHDGDTGPLPPRERGTRERLLLSACELFLANGYEGTSVAVIAQRAEAFPNQVTHHFGGKEALFVEATSRMVLRTAKQAELRTRQSPTPEAHARGLISYLLGPGSGVIMLFAEAMLMSRRRDALSRIIRDTIEELRIAGEAAMVDTLMRTGWRLRTTPDMVSRGFWSAILGLALEKAALGAEFDYTSAEAAALMMINLDGHLADRTER
ncbi:MAG: TetR family transcriptional regulator [Rhodobacteraceae bacterium]|nr:TetR family transcriptional regulator [Paracoccaceae bacterium]MBR9823607.1 TetR family transcriptional regulator [Paracoccaceae bacterium]